MKNQSGWLFVLLVFVVPFTIFALVNWYGREHRKLPVLGSVTDFSLPNQDSEIVSLSNWEGKIVVADFFFTNCGTICPKMTVNMKKAAKEFINDDEVRFSSFTVDPERDSAAALKDFAKRVGLPLKNWDLVTGSKPEIYKLARNGFKIVATDGDGGPEDFIHSSRFVLIDKQKRIRGYYDGVDENEVEQLMRDVVLLKQQ